MFKEEGASAPPADCRTIVLDRDQQARWLQDERWIFAGTDLGASVRLDVDANDWSSICDQAEDDEAALTILERLAAFALTIEDSFGGYFVSITAGDVAASFAGTKAKCLVAA